MPSSTRPARLVVDANAIVAALLGGQARRIFFESGVREFALPEAALEEVRSHVPDLALKLDVSPSRLESTLGLLPLRQYARTSYLQTLPEAARRIAERDPSDVDVLALALRLKLPVWSNDRDFEGTGVERFTTAQLLALFFPRPGGGGAGQRETRSGGE